ncbi:MAG: shikimate kinase [Gemmatimonadetes bacterium]|nr:shikimate kinase [Gemmatimonadota bacterium]
MTGVVGPESDRDGEAGATTLGPVLIGMRGSGKSTVAPLVAARLEMAWVDCDAELERREGSAVTALLGAGEGHFRAKELEVLLDLLDRSRTVLATGGGAVLHPPVRERLQARFTAWLDAPPDVLVHRLGGTARPPLTHLSPLEELRHLLAEREPWYREASTLRVDVSREPPEAVAERIAQAWDRALPQEG